MRLDTTVFNNLNTRRMRLTRWTKPTPPQFQPDPIKTIRDFARYRGMGSIPTRTIARLKTDPYFRYCFFALREHSLIYGSQLTAGKHLGDRLEAILRNPDAADEKDLQHGLRQYLNNFIGYMPNGLYRERYAADQDSYAGYKPILDLVDQILLGKDPEKKVVALNGENVAYLKLCLEVFNTLAKKHQYDPQQLWA